MTCRHEMSVQSLREEYIDAQREGNCSPIPEYILQMQAFDSRTGTGHCSWYRERHSRALLDATQAVRQEFMQNPETRCRDCGCRIDCTARCWSKSVTPCNNYIVISPRNLMLTSHIALAMDVAMLLEHCCCCCCKVRVRVTKYAVSVRGMFSRRGAARRPPQRAWPPKQRAKRRLPVRAESQTRIGR